MSSAGIITDEFMPAESEENKKIRELEKKVRFLERKLNQDNLARLLIEEANDRYQNIYKYVLTEITKQKEEIEDAKNILNEKNIQIESANQQLKIAKEKAEQSDRFKSEFLANMSHEIRTPMNAVIGYLSLLEETGIAGRQADYVREIKAASELLLFLVNDILDLSKIESGKMVFENKNFSLDQVIRESASLNIPRAVEKGLCITVNCDKSIPSSLKGDPMRLKQVLNNLITNAVKFTTTGGVTVDALYTGKSGSRESVNISVSDTGPGIKDDEKEIIFEPFVQSMRNDIERTGGTGLGLSICKKIIRHMGSDIHLESESGKGSKFYFDLFLEKGDSEVTDSGIEREKQPETGINKDISILIAEDNPTSLKLFLNLIQKLGLKADTAVNGAEAVAMSRRKAYNLILLDNIMPVKSGYEAAKEIRESGKSMNAIIIGITAGLFEEEKKKFFKAGMNDFIFKPVIPDKFRRMIAGFFPDNSDMGTSR